MIKAAIFDVFGTLTDWRSGVAAEVARALPGGPDPHAFADAWRGEYDPAMARIRDGNRGYVRLDTLHYENLERVLARFGLSGALAEAEKRELNHAWEKLPPWPDVAEGMDLLRPDLFLAPCSNGSVALMTRLARFAGFRWDCILGAEPAQGYKPDPKVYLKSCEALQLAPAEVIMIAAHNGDLAAAAAAGLKTGFIPRPEEHGPNANPDLAPTGDWDHVAGDLPALARLILSSR